MSPEEAKERYAAASVKQADGQPRHGTAARACCPTDPKHVAAELHRLYVEAARIRYYLQGLGSIKMERSAQTLCEGLARLHEDMTGKPEEGPAGNNPLVRAAAAPDEDRVQR